MAFAFIFDSVSGGEWLVLLAVVLICVGPKNLPSAARKLGKIMSTLRRTADEFKRQLMAVDDEVRMAATEMGPSDTAGKDPEISGEPSHDESGFTEPSESASPYTDMMNDGTASGELSAEAGVQPVEDVKPVAAAPKEDLAKIKITVSHGPAENAARA